MNEDRYRRAEKILWAGTGCSPSERMVRLRRIGTEVRVQEVGEGAPVLFIHGGPNSGSTWAPLAPYMVGFRCLLVDRPGTGLSPAHAVTPENLPAIGAAFVADVLDGLGLERAHVVASSFGGHLALRSAAATPERFRRMVQMACPALSPGERPPLFQHLFRVRTVRRLLNVLPPNRRANRVIMQQLGHGKSLAAGRIPQTFFDWYLELQRHTDTNRNDGEMIAGALAARPRLELTRALMEAVRVQTLFLWGEDDTFGGLDVARTLAEAMPEARLEVMPAAGHLPWLDDPEHAAGAVRDFLAGEADASSVLRMSPRGGQHLQPAHEDLGCPAMAAGAVLPGCTGSSPLSRPPRTPSRMWPRMKSSSRVTASDSGAMVEDSRRMIPDTEISCLLPEKSWSHGQPVLHVLPRAEGQRRGGPLHRLSRRRTLPAGPGASNRGGRGPVELLQR